MAATLNFKFVANDSGLKQGINSAQDQMSGLEKHTQKISAGMKAAIGAIGFAALAHGIVDATKAAEEDQIAQNKLALQIRNSTDATDAQINNNEKFITAMSKAAAVSDDELRPALANAVRKTGDLSEAQNLLKIGLDASAATGKPLTAVMQVLTKAVNGHEEALYKLDPSLEASKGGMEEFAASVEGAAGTNASPMKRFSIALDEAKETIGAAFIPVLEKLMNALSPIIDKLAPVLAKLIGALAPIFTDLVDAILPLVEELLPPLLDLLRALMPVIEPIVKILTVLLVPIVKVLSTVIQAVLKFIKPLIDAFGTFAQAIPKAFEGVGKFFKGLVNGYIAIWEGFINFFIDGVNLIPTALNKIHVKLPDWLGGAEIGFKIPTIGHVHIPRLANGGIVMPSPGGSLVNVAEAGKPEAIIPLDRMNGMGGNTYVININKASLTGDEVLQAIRRYEVQNGRRFTY
jgi:hypothetical protein